MNEIWLACARRGELVDMGMVKGNAKALKHWQYGIDHGWRPAGVGINLAGQLLCTQNTLYSFMHKAGFASPGVFGCGL